MSGGGGGTLEGEKKKTGASSFSDGYRIPCMRLEAIENKRIIMIRVRFSPEDPEETDR